MSLRWKLLILLLAIALLPLIFTTIITRNSLRTLGAGVAADVRAGLAARANDHYQQLILAQADAVRLQKVALEQTVRMQARAAERLLANPSAPPATILFTEDFTPVITPVARAAEFRRMPEPSAPEPPPSLSYDHHAIHVAPQVDPVEAYLDTFRLSALVADFRFVRQLNPLLAIWQSTALESGVSAVYPAHGGYPDDYDPRRTDWYRAACADPSKVHWVGPRRAAAADEIVLTAALAIHHPDGSFAGVAAVDVELALVVERLRPPRVLGGEAEAMLVTADLLPDRRAVRPRVVARPAFDVRPDLWDTPMQPQWLESSDTAALEAVCSDMLRGVGGARPLDYGGRRTLWVYGSIDAAGSFLLLIIPYDTVIAEAQAAQAFVLERTGSQLAAAGAVALLAVLVVVLCALVGSRTVTEPIQELVAAADRIATGDFEAHVRVRTADELGRLGRQFNAMVPQLRDHLRLKQSVALAMEVQQHLLPQEAPRLAGFDLAGESVYCDETGGDYYDFLDPVLVGSGRLGVAIGDVTGHGVAAAMLMATARAMLRSCSSRGDSPARTLTDMNRWLYTDMHDGRFMTLHYMVLDAQERSVRWSCAGHDPVIRYDPASDTFDELAGRDLPLGVEPDWQYHDSGPLPLALGQVLVMGTDGVWECRDRRGRFFGKQELRNVIRECADQSAKGICSAIIGAIVAFRRDRRIDDDAAVVVVKVE